MDLSGTVIIAGDAELTERVCSRLRKPHIYLAVIEAPTVRMEKYGLFDGDCIRVTNAVLALKPKKLLFVKVNPRVAEKLKEHLRHIQPVCIETFDEHLLTQHVQFNQAIVGFLDLQLSDPHCRYSDLFVVEGEFNITHVIAANLAAAHRGRVIPIAQVSDDEVNNLREKSRVWSNGSPSEKNQAKDAILEFARNRLPNWLLNLQTAKSVSFISRGIPYGVLPFRCPTTHYFSFPLLGLSVLSGMLKSQRHVRCPIAILIDPHTVGQSEFTALQKTLGNAGYMLRQAYGKRATVKDATYLCVYMPCDFIFFSTHCGELDGQRIIERFPDRHGNNHEFCYDQALSICQAPGTDLFEVVFLYVPISMDGVNWTDDEAKKRINAGILLEDFLERSKKRKESEEKPEILSNVKSERIKGFEALRMSDGNYFPIPQMVGGFHYPVVFNNACSSWRTLAMNFGCNGASVYVGTATDISNFVAVPVASSFVRAITSKRSIGMALFRSQKKFTEQFGYTPYLMHGYLYTDIANPKSQDRSRIIPRIGAAIEAVKRIPNSNKEAPALHFLEQELAVLLTSLKAG